VARSGRSGRPGLRRVLGWTPPGRGHDRGRSDRDPPRRRRRVRGRGRGSVAGVRAQARSACATAGRRPILPRFRPTANFCPNRAAPRLRGQLFAHSASFWPNVRAPLGFGQFFASVAPGRVGRSRAGRSPEGG
jgi:hypothetical protein